MGICARSIPTPPLLHLHQTRESMTPASPEIRNQTALLLRKQPSGADLNVRRSGRRSKLAVSLQKQELTLSFNARGEAQQKKGA